MRLPKLRVEQSTSPSKLVMVVRGLLVVNALLCTTALVYDHYYVPQKVSSADEEAQKLREEAKQIIQEKAL